MLEAMRRRYTVGEFVDLVADIREAIPEMAMSTDIIVGFPGETDDDYDKTVNILQQIRFDFAYLFKYSERDGTYAARNLDDSIDEELKGKRLSDLIAMQEEISAEVFGSRIGETFEVMVEGESKRDSAELCGRTDDFKMVVFPKPESHELNPGDFVDVRIDDATSHTLLGECISP